MIPQAAARPVADDTAPLLLRPRRAQPARHRRTRRWLRRLAVVLVAVVLAAGGGVLAVWLLTPSVSNAPQRVRAILAAHHAPSDGGQVPAKVASALLATEDSRFYHEGALDPRGVARGLSGFVTGNANAGGATITQQLAKLLYTPGNSDFMSELEQVGLAFKLDAHFTKTQILSMYLDAAYFGDGAYGVTAASEHYFGKPAADLSWAQASLLAGLVQAPTAYDPHGHLSLARQRQMHVLARLVATGVLTKAEAAAAGTAPLNPVEAFSG